MFFPFWWDSLPILLHTRFGPKMKFIYKMTRYSNYYEVMSYFETFIMKNIIYPALGQNIKFFLFENLDYLELLKNIWLAVDYEGRSQEI